MPDDRRHLVLLETSGNQDYVFASNRQREMLAASYLTWASTMVEVKDLIAQDPRLNSVLITSGKAVVRASSKGAAQDLVFHATDHALRQAPGLDLRGVSLPLDWANDDGATAEQAHAAVSRLYRLMEAARGESPGASQRLPGFPAQARCASTGLPAERLVSGKLDPSTGDEGPRAVSAATHARLDLVREGRNELAERFLQLTRRRQDELIPEADGRKELDEALGALAAAPWLAVVHADGTGVGQIFMEFDRMLEGVLGRKGTAAEYFDRLGRFSAALDACGRNALIAAVEGLPLQAGRKRAPLVPLVQGGDDLTVLCLGHHALAFTKAYLLEFERATAAHDDIKALAAAAQNGVERLSACAGITVVGAHFPFHLAYDMCSDLESNAKKSVKQNVQDTDRNRVPCSAFDFHVHYDSSGGDLDSIRDRLVLPTGERLHARPYVVTKREDLAMADDAARAWVGAHHVGKLDAAVSVCAFSGEDDDKNVLASAPLHLLRSRCFEGEAAAKAALALLKAQGRLPDQPALFGPKDSPSLFFPDPVRATRTDGPPAKPLRITRLLDAIDAARLLSERPEVPAADGGVS